MTGKTYKSFSLGQKYSNVTELLLKLVLYGKAYERSESLGLYLDGFRIEREREGERVIIHCLTPQISTMTKVLKLRSKNQPVFEVGSRDP